jgi:hypothetical protein
MQEAAHARQEAVKAAHTGQEAIRIVGDDVITKRVIDPATAPIVHRIFDDVAAGATFGAVTRALTRRASSAGAATLGEAGPSATIVHNEAYAGRKGSSRGAPAPQWRHSRYPRQGGYQPLPSGRNPDKRGESPGAKDRPLDVVQISDAAC